MLCCVQKPTDTGTFSQPHTSFTWLGEKGKTFESKIWLLHRDRKKRRERESRDQSIKNNDAVQFLPLSEKLSVGVNPATYLDRSAKAGNATPQCHGHSNSTGTWLHARTSPRSLQFDKMCGFLSPGIGLKYKVKEAALKMESYKLNVSVLEQGSIHSQF